MKINHKKQTNKQKKKTSKNERTPKGKKIKQDIIREKSGNFLSRTPLLIDL